MNLHDGGTMVGAVGITCCSKPFGIWPMPNHAASDYCVRAVDEAVGALPMLLPARAGRQDLSGLLSRLDGLLLTGSRSNVQPGLYGGPRLPPEQCEDPARDAVTLPLIRAALAAGVPILGLCRGLQEMNVALGGTLHAQLAEQPGRFDHAAPMLPSHEVRVGHAHDVTVVRHGLLRRIAGRSAFAVNSLHHQAIDRPGRGVVIEAEAPDGTIEAIRVTGAPGWALGVQWHPEFDWRTDEISHAIFAAFGREVARRAAGMHPAAAAD